MGIFLNSNYGLKNNIDNSNTQKTEASSGKISSLPEYVSALKEGSVFKGEILDVRNNAIKILLSSNDILNARMDGSVQLNIGDILNFKVESNSGMNMLVKAVSIGNANMNNMLLEALQSADVPVNERNITLVKELVDNGQAIDKNTIKTLVSNLNSFKELDIDTAVTMFKHDIPITEDNIAQYNNYIEQNNKLLTSFNNLTDNIIDTVIDYVKNNGEDAGVQLLNDIVINITTGENTENTTILSNDVNVNIENEFGVEVKDLLNNEVANKDNLEGKALLIENSDVNTENSTKINANNFKNPVDIETTVKEVENKINENNEVVLKQEQLFTTDSFSDLNSIKDEIKSIINKNLFINKEIFNKSDEDIKEEVEKYFKEVDSKTEKLLNVLENAGLNKSAMHENVSEIKSNLKFMNDINNMALYMQIPVKFQDSEAHGELYVLNRNRNKVKNNDVITAFLHLDMESLGATDVNIRLEHEQLTTKFTLEDTISQEIVEQHLPELKKRLDEKGYTTTLLIEEIDNNTEEANISPFERVLNLEEPKNYIKRYTLDVRA